MVHSLPLLVAAALFLGGCSKQTWTKAELIDWYVGFGDRKPKIGYAGSDAEYHYFATRPIDSWVLPRVARSEITIEDASLGRRFWFYVVDPTLDFAKVPNSDAPE